ncbi:MAG TPA: lactate utilization protein [Nanoarchaeota archaeon]|nr:lactate utilization protein [Nanoarchaeota archaeon]
MTDVAKLVEERAKGRDAILQFALEYKAKRENALSGENEEELKNRLEAIRKNSITNLSALKSRAIASLAANGFVVHEAKNAEEAVEKAKEAIGKEKLIVKSKSNTLDEIKIEEALEGREVVETDLGDFMNQVAGNKDMHPVMPALNLTPRDMANAIREKFKEVVEAKPEAIAGFAREYLREKLIKAKVGISGANAVTAQGNVIMLENEGNISLVSRMPDTHIIVVGIDRIVENVEEAMHVAKCSAIWGTGQKWTSYVSVISGPSKTADVQNKLVVGAQGAKEVHIILLDNGRTQMINEGFGELLQCIGCGACLNFCPAFHQVQNGFGCDALGGIKGVVTQMFRKGKQAAFECGAFYCLTCLSCKFNCPAKIGFGKYLLKTRELLVKEGLEPEASKKMAEKAKATGNPFGSSSENPKELYCC